MDSIAQSDAVSEMKKEMLIMKKELIKVNGIIVEKDKEVEKLKKENFNLVNRCRNTLKK
jgi:hypothetical protein